MQQRQGICAEDCRLAAPLNGRRLAGRPNVVQLKACPSCDLQCRAFRRGAMLIKSGEFLQRNITSNWEIVKRGEKRQLLAPGHLSLYKSAEMVATNMGVL